MSAPDSPPPVRSAGRNRRRLRTGVAALTILAAGAVGVPALLHTLPAGRGGNGQEQPAAETPQPAPSAAESKSPRPAFYQQPGPPKGSPLLAVEPLALTVSAAPTGTVLPAGLVGLSLEATDLADPLLDGGNDGMVELLRGLGTPLLRFGGNAVDRRFFWTSRDEPQPAGLTGDKAHPVRTVTPADLERVDTLLDAADATISLTVDLGHYDPARAADMAAHAQRIFGDRLLGITVGNEPNGFVPTGLRPAGWTVASYLKELRTYAEALAAAAPGVPLIGPGAYEDSWWEPFAAAALPQQKILSFHHYPMSTCNGPATDPGAPTLANMTSRNTHDWADHYRQQALSRAAGYGLATWIAETGPSACPGSNETSRTHASALWSADYALGAAYQGVSRLGFHSSLITCTGGPPMSAVCTGGRYLKPDGKVHERANYFGLSMVGTLEPGKFLQTGRSGDPLTYSYAVEHGDGSTSVILVNQNNPQQAAQTQVTLTLPGRPAAGTMSQLAGPSFSAEDGTRIDGVEAPPGPADERLPVPGFSAGTETQTLAVTAGTVTVLNYRYATP